MTMPNYTYCVSCSTGGEAILKTMLQKKLPQAVILYPLFDREEHKGGEWYVKTYSLLPGYLFIYSDTEIAPEVFYREKRVNRLLGYRNIEGYNNHFLSGKDLEFADWVYTNEGHIKLSRAVLVGDRTKIIDGPLLNYEGEILKINRHRRSALVRIEIGEIVKDVWLYFKWMTFEDGELVEWH